MNETCTHFTAVCPGCQVGLKVKNKYNGQWVRCQHCNQKFHAMVSGAVASSESTASDPAAAASIKDVNGSRLKIACPGCATTLKPRAEYAGRNIRCGKCGRKFRVEGQPPAPRDGALIAEGAPAAAVAWLIQTTNALAERNQRLRGRQRELRHALLQLQAEVQQIAPQDRGTDGDHALGELKRLHDELRVDLDLLKHRLESEEAQPAPVEQGLAAFQQRHDELNAAIDGLKQLIEADDRPERHDRALAELSRRHDESRRSIEQLQTQLQTADAEQRNGIKSQLDELTAAIDDLKARLHTVEAEAQAPRHDEALSGLNSRHDDLTDAIGRLAARLQEIEADARTPRQDEALSGLRARHDELTAVIERLQNRIQGIEAETQAPRHDEVLDGLKSRHDELTVAIDLLNDRVQTLADDDRAASRDQDVADLKSRHDDLRRAIDLLTKQAAAQPTLVEQGLAAFQQRHDELNTAIDGLKQLIEADDRPERHDRARRTQPAPRRIPPIH